MTQFPDLFAALAAPFEPSEIKAKNQSGRQLHYITARTAMNRLDTILGPENWWDQYIPGEKSVLCVLTIRLPDGSTLSKSDAGGYAGMADSGDDDKSGYSDAFKRAAVKFGVARYLYRDGVPAFVEERCRDREAERAAQGGDAGPKLHTPPPEPHRKETGKWGNPTPVAEAEPAAGRATNGNGRSSGPPRTGKALFAFLKEAEQRHRVGVLKYANSFMKLQGLPSRIVDLDAEQVSLVYEEVLRKLKTVGRGDNDAYDEAYA